MRVPRQFGHCVTICLALLLSACGGGGGDGGGGDSPRLPPTPATRVVLTRQNAEDVSGLTLALTQSALAFATFAAEGREAFLRNPGAQRLRASCPFGGNIFLDWTDRDSNGTLSANDEIRVTYASCAIGGQTTDGAFDVLYLAIATNPADEVVSARIRFGGLSIRQSGATASFAGQVQVEHRSESTRDTLILSTTQFSVILDGGPETLTALDHRVVQDYAASTYEIVSSGSVNSTALGGAYDFATQTAWRGTLGSFPTAGSLRFTGAANSSLRLVEGDPRESASDLTLLLIDINGDGTDEVAEPLSWSQFADPLMFIAIRDDAPAPPSPPPPPPPPPAPPPPNVVQLAGRGFNLFAGEIRDVASDPVRRRVYLSVLNDIVVLSAETYLIENRFFVGSSPAGMAMAADGTQLYVALGAGGSVAIVDLETYQVETVEIATEMASPHVIDVLEVRPGVILASGIRYEGEVYLATIDTQDGNRIRRVAGGEVVLGEPSLSRSGDRRYVFVGNRDSPASILKLDAQSPDVPILARSAATSAIAQLASNLDGTRLITGGGGVWDATTMTRISAGFVDGNVAAQNDHSRIMRSGGSSELSMIDAATLTEIGRFTTDCPRRGMNGIAAVGLRDEWILNLSGHLCVVSLSNPQVPPGVDGSRALAPRIEPSSVSALETDIGGFGWDMELDTGRDVAYVSLPLDAEIVVVPIDNGGMSGVVPTPDQPRRMTMSGDGRRLFVALWGSGSVAVIDLETLQVERVLNLAALLGHSNTHDLVEAAPGRLFVTASSETGERAFLVEVDPDNPGSARRVGRSDGYFMPFLYLSSDRKFLYVADSWWPTLMEKRDLASPTFEVVMTSEPQGSGDIGLGALSPDGARLYLPNGVFMSTTTLRQIGMGAQGLPRVSADNREVSVASGRHVLTYRADTLEWVGSVMSDDCVSVGYAMDFAVLPDRSRFVILGGGGSSGSVCVMNSAP